MSPSTPWATFTPLDSLLVYPGDSILLRRGDTLRGTLRPRLKADVDWSTPLVIASYGPSTRPPLLLGTVPVTGWSMKPGDPGTWQAPFPGTTAASRLFINGRTVRGSRVPAGGWYTLTAPEGDTALVAGELGDDNWVGATIHIKTTPWNIDARQITAMSGGRVSLSSPTNAPIRDGWGYFVTGLPRTLSNIGQWMQDSASDLIVIRPNSTQTVQGTLVEVSTVPSGINIYGKHDITIEGLDFLGHSDFGIDARGTSNVTIRRCRAYRVDQWGFKVSGRNSKVFDSRVVLSSTGGMDVLGPGCVVERDTVEYIGDMSQFGPRGHGGECCGGRGMEIYGDSCTIRSNVVRWTGWSGITFGGKSVVVEGNTIDSALRISNDGGGLYSYGSKWEGNGMGTVIRDNIVTRSFGNNQGSPGYPRLGIGIYFDNMIQGARASDNTLIDNSWGVLVHNNRDLVVSRNTIVSDSVGIMVSRDSYSPDDAWNNRIDSNVILAVHPATAIENVVKVDNHGHTLATFHNNVACTDHPLETTCYLGESVLWSLPRLALVERATGKERFPPLVSGINGWRGYPATTFVEEGIGVSGDVLKFSVKLTGDATTGGILLRDSGVKIDSGDLSLLSFKARGAQPGMQVQLKLQQAHAPYQRLATPVLFQLDTIWKEFKTVFTSSASDSSARIDFVLNRSDSMVWISGVSWKGIDTSGVGALRYSSVSWNRAPFSRSYDLGSGPWRSPLGTPLASSGMLDPRKALFGLKDTGTGIAVDSRPLRPKHGFETIHRSGDRLSLRIRSMEEHAPRLHLRGLDGALIAEYSLDLPDGTRSVSIPVPPRAGVVCLVLSDSFGKIIDSRAIALP
ncbi:MAG: right-handed parallel beta-helix repeat-containing protein [Fibrobacteria bacterium]|nr:right-handed parallel beta-helix repeat-containing protein [Fibrobacteria bacterium]